MKRWIRIISLVLLLVIAGIVIYKNLIPANKTKERQTTKVVQGNLEEKLTISGEINAEEHVTLRFQTSGRLAWVGVKEGEYVKKYQGIASLDQREVRKTLEKYLNTYLSERWDFEQTTRDDYKDRVITNTIKRILEKAQFDLNSAILDVELKELAVQYANLWTPIGGVVIRIGSPFAGVNITPAQAEFEIINPNTVYFSALADQTEVTKLTTGISGELVLDAYPDETNTGSIKSISFIPKAGETGTVYEVKFVFPSDNSNYKYRFGMAGDLSFITRKKENVLYLPLKYVKTINGNKYVLVRENGKEEKRQVEIGMETDDYVEVIKGVTEGQIIYE